LTQFEANRSIDGGVMDAQKLQPGPGIQPGVQGYTPLNANTLCTNLKASLTHVEMHPLASSLGYFLV